VHDLEHVAVGQAGRGVLGARHHLTVSLDGDRAVGQAEVLDQSADGDAVRDLLGIAVYRELHRGFSLARKNEGRLERKEDVIRRLAGRDKTQVGWKSVARFWLAAGLVVGAAALGAGVAVYNAWLPAEGPLPGLHVTGREVPQSAALGEWLEQRRRALLDREAYLAVPDDSVQTSLGRLGVELDVAESMRRTVERSQQGSLGARIYRARQARLGLVEVEAAWSFDPNRARAELERLAPRVKLDPVDARLDLVAHRRIDDQPGRVLDVERTLKAIAGGERDELAVFQVHTRDIPAQVTSAMLLAIDVTKVLSSFETKFAGNGRGRSRNIERAAELLNGTVVAPGQTISFNQIVGPRVIERGFTWAPEIVNDEMENGVGGGVCQVASTVHAASVYGELEVVQRRSHSRPSGYAPLGLDATVIYGEVDLKLRNPYDSPLMIHAFLPQRNLLRVELLGREAPGPVEHVYAVIKSEEFFRKVVSKPELEHGKHVRRQKGIRGYDVVSVVQRKLPDGSVRKRQYYSKYYPVPEVFWIGPGVDPGALGDLPAGAKHVEVNGALDVSTVRNPYSTDG
jgi:vancomycin resistance protein YoaR